jgi:hypothetical protein
LDNSTLKRRLARFTRSMRVSMGLASKVGHGPASLPFRRETPQGSGTKSRVDALEVDLERLVRGWDQHLPQLIATVANVRADVFEAAQLQIRLQRLEEAVARLESEAGVSVKATAREAGKKKRQG